MASTKSTKFVADRDSGCLHILTTYGSLHTEVFPSETWTSETAFIHRMSFSLYLTKTKTPILFLMMLTAISESLTGQRINDHTYSVLWTSDFQ